LAAFLKFVKLVEQALLKISCFVKTANHFTSNDGNCQKTENRFNYIIPYKQVGHCSSEAKL